MRMAEEQFGHMAASEGCRCRRFFSLILGFSE
jgi:hypothetical protein